MEQPPPSSIAGRLQSLTRMIWTQLGRRIAGPAAVRGLGALMQIVLAAALVRTQNVEVLGSNYLMFSWAMTCGTILSFGSFAYCMKKIGALGDTPDMGTARYLVGWSIKISIVTTAIAGLLIAVSGSAQWIAVHLGLTVEFLVYLWPLSALYAVRKVLCESSKALHAPSTGLFFEWSSVPLLTMLGSIAWWFAHGGVFTDAQLYCLMMGSECISIAALAGFQFFLARNAPAAGAAAMQIKPSLRECAAIGYAVAVQVLFLNFPYLIIPGRLSPAAIGIFGVGTRLSGTAMLFLEVVITVYAPRFARAFHAGVTHDLKAIYRRAQRSMWMTSIPVLVAIVLLRDPLLHIVGDKTLPARDVLVILSVGRLVQAFGGPVSYFMWMTGHERTEMLSTIAAIAAMIAAVLLLPSVWTIDALGIVVLVGYVVRQAIQLWVLETRIFRERGAVA